MLGIEDFEPGDEIIAGNREGVVKRVATEGTNPHISFQCSNHERCVVESAGELHRISDVSIKDMSRRGRLEFK